MKLSASAWKATAGGFAVQSFRQYLTEKWEAAGCPKHTKDDDQTQTAQSTLLSDRRMQLQHKNCGQCDFTASSSQTR